MYSSIETPTIGKTVTMFCKECDKFKEMKYITFGYGEPHTIFYICPDCHHAEMREQN